MSWFEDWFDSPLYEKLYANRDEEEAARMGAFLLKVLPGEQYNDILDLGCGRGRHSLWLAEQAYKVTGIDLSREAIHRAKEKAVNRGLENVRFIRRDMRKPLDQSFDAVVNLFTTFGYFESDRENSGVFDSIRSMLKDDGKLVIDFFNAEKVRKEYLPRSEGRFGEWAWHIRRYLENDFIKKEITFQDELTGKIYRYEERVKLYDPDWFTREMEQRGFSIVNLYGDYRGNHFDEKQSDRLLIEGVLDNRLEI